MLKRKHFTIAQLKTIDLFSIIALSIRADGDVECIIADSSKRISENETFDICVPTNPQHSICIKEMHVSKGFAVIKIEGNVTMVQQTEEVISILIGNMKMQNMDSSYFPGFTLSQHAQVYMKNETEFVSHKNIDMVRIHENIVVFSLIGNPRSFRSIPIRKATQVNNWVGESMVIFNLQKDVVGLGRIHGKKSPLLPMTFRDGEICDYSFYSKSIKTSQIDIPQKMIVEKQPSARYMGPFALSVNASRDNSSLHVFMDNARIFFSSEKSCMA